MKAEEIDVNLIYPNPFQPRRYYEPDGIRELTESVKSLGVITPILVRRAARGYELIAGERRLRAAKNAGLKTIPAVIREMSDSGSAVASIVENIQRRNLNCFEEAESISRLMNYHGLTQEEISKMLSKSQSAVANKLRLLKLSRDVRAKMTEYGLTERHGRALLRLDNERQQLEAVEKIGQGGMSVAMTEKMIQRMIDENIKANRRIVPRTSVKSTRTFINTLIKTVDVLKKKGAVATTKEVEYDDYIEYVVKIAK
ncbi:MAG: ParB/RepB/Spo0J family partition protein [Clostridia bacterium]